MKKNIKPVRLYLELKDEFISSESERMLKRSCNSDYEDTVIDFRY